MQNTNQVMVERVKQNHTDMDALVKERHEAMDQLVRRLQEQTEGRLATMEEQLSSLQAQTKNSQELIAGVGWIITNQINNITTGINRLGLIVGQGTAILVAVGSFALQCVLRAQSLSTRLERPVVEESFILMDYLGTQFRIPLSYVDSWAVFDGSLQGKFKDKKGGRRIAQKRFSLEYSDGGSVIDRELDWKKAIVPGKTVQMSLFCQLASDWNDGKALLCSFCKELGEDAPEQVFLQW